MAVNGLSIQSQDDFSAGAFPGYSRDLIPANGVEDAVNCLINDDGQLYRRGGSTYKSNADLTDGGSTTGARFLWDGRLAVGQRTLVSGLHNISVLDTDDTSLVLLSSIYGTPRPQKGVVVGGMLVLPQASGSTATLYGGSRKTSDYSTGTISLTPGSDVVVGAGTTWTGNVDAGMVLDTVPIPVESVTDNTHIKLVRPYPDDASALVGQPYTLKALQPVSSTPHLPTNGSYIFASAGGRLLTLTGNRVYMSGIYRPDDTRDDSYYELPAECLAAEEVRGTAIVFTTDGVWAISNIALDLTDNLGNPQQRVDLINRDLVLWSNPGIANYGGGLIVPAVDGVWLMDGVSSPQRITGGITTLYRSYVDAGYTTGIAGVHRGHYSLPILDGSANVVDTLICRLQATRRGTAFGWTRASGSAANNSAYAQRVGSGSVRQPYLLGADATNGRIKKLTFWDGTPTTDADGSTPQATVISSEPNDEISTVTKKVRIRYELTDPSTVNPTMTAEWAQASGSYTTLSGSAPETTKPTTYTWPVNQRNPHIRLQTVGATSNWVLHSITRFVRPSGRQ